MNQAINKTYKYLHIIFWICLSIMYSSVYAWPTENGITICTSMNDQVNPVIISDGVGGAIITWQDYRYTTSNPLQGADIFTQRIDSTGSSLWMENGLAVCTSLNNQYNFSMTDDGNGGAIITWTDNRNGTAYNIYAQRINASGNPQWNQNGITVSISSNNQFSPKITSDNSGGAIITWEDYRNGVTTDIYAQRINSIGSTLWLNNGIAICTASNNQGSVNITIDGLGGGIITWNDLRNGIKLDIYAQRINSNGSTLWLTDGVTVCTATNDQLSPKIINDNSGGAIILWQDTRDFTFPSGPAENDLYAQRVNSNGSTLWIQNGIALNPGKNAQNFPEYPAIVSDNSGGAFVSWNHPLNGSANFNIFAHRIDPSGNLLWSLSGVTICNDPYDQYSSAISNDDSGGAIIIWSDPRNGISYNIYAQRVNSSGSTYWTENGVSICTVGDAYDAKIVSDGDNGAIITWRDNRNGNYDIYAQSINSDGLTPIRDWMLYTIESRNQ